MTAQSRKTGLIITGAVAIVGVAVLGLNAVNRAKSVAPAIASQSISSPQSGGTPQRNDAGGVQVQVTFDPGASGAAKTLVFQVAMNNHAIDLGKYDLSKMSRVTLQPGGSLAGLTWKPEGTGAGHHVSGTLVAADPAGLAAKAQSVTLEIQGLAGVEVRRFEWSGAAQ